MCGRYAVGYGPRPLRQRLQAAGLPVDQIPAAEGEADNDDIRRHFNVAPGNVEVVYRAIPDDAAENPVGLTYVLENMKWGLIPSWTKRPPAYSSVLKAINCRADSLAQQLAGMRNMKRCVVVAMGFYEWLHKGREKIPHFVKRADGGLMLFAGLWDCVQYEGKTEKLYTYAIITTEANSQLAFLHERMPAILDPSEVRDWLSPTTPWNAQLQSLLKPFPGALEIYPVTKDVGRVGRDSPNFVIPIDSPENKENIKNLFAKKAREDGGGKGNWKVKKEEEDAQLAGPSTPMKRHHRGLKKEEEEEAGPSTGASSKRHHRPEDSGDEDPARKILRPERPEEAGDEEFARKLAMEEEEKMKMFSPSPGVKTRSATRNRAAAQKKKGVDREVRSQKITSFFK